MAEISKFFSEHDLRGLRSWLIEAGTLDIAEALSRIESDQRALMFRLVPKNRALTVFEMLDPSIQQDILISLREPNVREILERMEPDDRARLLDEMPAELAKQLLEGLSAKERKLTSILLGYPENSVGRIMSPEYVDLQVKMNVSEALAHVRRSGRGVEAIYSLPITDDHDHLLDVIDLADLVLANPEASVGNLVSEESYSVRADEDQEKASRLLVEAGLMALPVTDSEGRLVGVLTFDDAMEVLQESDTEDIQRSGGSEPLGAPYLSVSIFHLTRSRVIWLLFLAFAASITVNVLNLFQETLESAITLSLFIPFLIGIGGNVGSQSTTIIIRAMALGEVRFGDFFTVVLREVRVGILLGFSISAIGFIPITYFFHFKIALILSLSILSITTIAALSGSLLPMAAKRIGVDPAVMSAPIIATLVDASGLVIYFFIAKTVLGI
jgi:magnesium transporter